MGLQDEVNQHYFHNCIKRYYIDIFVNGFWKRRDVWNLLLYLELSWEMYSDK